MGLLDRLFGTAKATPQPQPRASSTPKQSATPTSASDAAARALLSEMQGVRVPKTSSGNTLHAQLNGAGISDDDMRQTVARVLADTGKAPTIGELLQAISRHVTAQPSSEISDLGVTLYSAAVSMNQAGRDDHFPPLYESGRIQLLEFKRSGIDRVKISSAGDEACPACRSQKLVWATDEALRDMPIPAKGCTHRLDRSDGEHGFCRCTWVMGYDY